MAAILLPSASPCQSWQRCLVRTERDGGRIAHAGASGPGRNPLFYSIALELIRDVRLYGPGGRDVPGSLILVTRHLLGHPPAVKGARILGVEPEYGIKVLDGFVGLLQFQIRDRATVERRAVVWTQLQRLIAIIQCRLQPAELCLQVTPLIQTTRIPGVDADRLVHLLEGENIVAFERVCTRQLVQNLGTPFGPVCR